eukprot:2103713-Alexandrium_andersonii.AAC.1
MARLLVEKAGHRRFALPFPAFGRREIRRNLGEVNEVARPPKGERAPSLDGGWVLAVQGLLNVPAQMRHVRATGPQGAKETAEVFSDPNGVRGMYRQDVSHASRAVGTVRALGV